MLISASANDNFSSALGENELYIAAANDQVDVVGVLLDNGANIFTRGAHSDTAVHVAARNGNTAAVQELTICMGGAAASVMNDEGESAQAIAIERNDSSTTVAL
jgi:ankyrin repeat protein